MSGHISMRRSTASVGVSVAAHGTQQRLAALATSNMQPQLEEALGAFEPRAEKPIHWFLRRLRIPQA